MRLNKRKKEKVERGQSVCLSFFLFTFSFILIINMTSFAWARVNKDIQDYYEDLFEEKIYFLRVNLVVYGDAKRDEFLTDMRDFKYPLNYEGLTETIIFKKGDKVIIEKVDFDKDEIEIEISSVAKGHDGKVVFEFPQTLSHVFDESAAFTRRFDEIFFKESLKELPIYTDRISDLIRSGAIQIGMSRDELILTLGRPFDIVKRVTGEIEEAFIYKEQTRTFWFYFENDALIEWLEY